MFRFFAFLILAYLFALIQSAVVGELFPPLLKPDLMLVLVIYLGISLPLLPGAILVSFCGLLYDTFSGSPFGLFILHSLVVFFLLKVVAKFLILGESIRLRMLLLFLAVFFQRIFLILVPAAADISGIPPLLALTWMLPLQALTTCLAGWPLFRLMKKIELFAGNAPSPIAQKP